MITNVKMAIQAALLFLFVIKLDQIQSLYTDEIQTNSGKVRGLIQSSSLPGVKVQKFLNIPYAEAPVGQLRFEKPQPRKPWNNTLNSTQVNIACYQKYTPGWNFTEDCLILNIWTPYPKPQNATVMVYIHGGSFRSGSSGSQRHNGANFVAVGNVILVTINYRLSFLGFLSTGNKTIKGNLGLYDQRLAMKWVKQNIAAFGGNPKTITLFGLSAGAACVSAHTLSKESWPYFDQIILQSGNMLSTWSVTSETMIKAQTETFLKAVNCSNDERVLECLKSNITPEILDKIYKSEAVSNVDFAPTVDGEFLKDHPLKLFKPGQVKNCSIITGVTKDEMYYKNSEILWQTRNVSVIHQRFTAIVTSFFKDDKVSEYAIKLYSPECTPTFIEAFRPIVDVMTDYVFTCGSRQEAIERSTLKHNVYFYRYSYATPVPYSAYPVGQFGFAAHGADFLSSFGHTINNPTYPAEDQIISMRVVLYWTNFAKTGDPNSGTTKLPLVINNVDSLPTWPPHMSTEQKYLDMRSLSQMVVGRKIREKYCDFLANPKEVIVKPTTGSASIHTGHFLLFAITLLCNIL